MSMHKGQEWGYYYRRRLTTIRADHSSLTLSHAFTNARNYNITKDTPVYAVFFSGLMKIPIQVRYVVGTMDYYVDRIPAGVAGQSYVLLSRSCDDFSDRNVVAGPAVLEVYPKGMVPDRPHPGCA
ncbi:hypothetical protein N7G274_002391 [Stereocaulon virgatum]|uniref:Uncharacterized protein n=1 Tax=Stereocaulon virgatum TaxID=373712 RepID=A0ABR4APG1_9LECA